VSDGDDLIDEILLEAEEKMDKAISVAREDFASIRTGRATSAMFNKVLIDYYGTPTPVNQVASVQVPEARMLILKPYEKSTTNAIEKAIRDSDLGVNPTNDGLIIRVVLPALTEERRREYIKMARHKAEDAKVSMRNIRRSAKDDLEALMKDGQAGEDSVRRAEKALEDLTATHVGHVDEVLKAKEAELLEV
jgi:ribosome recycling factor